MTITVEDGTIVDGANSYVELQEVRDWATDRGITLPADDADLEPKVHLAMDWFEAYDFVGSRVDVAQALSFPRSGVVIDGIEYGENEIPPLVKDCVIQATIDAVSVELEPTIAGSTKGNLKKSKLDVIEKEYFEPTWSSQQPRLAKLMRMIQPLLGGGLGTGRLNVLRV